MSFDPFVPKRVLLIGYHYPPEAGVGAIRIAKFAKYLPDRWDIHVITSQPNHNDYSSGIFDRDGATIHRVQEPFDGFENNFDNIRWSAPVTWEVYNLHKNLNFDCIWQTGNPFLPLLTVFICNKLIDTNFIVDLRDSWTLHPYIDLTTIFGDFYGKTSRILEPRVLRAADAITVATDGINEAYANSYPEMKSKLYTVENGYDRNDFPKVETEPREGFDVVYVGKFSDFRDPEPFLKALSDIQSQRNVSFVHVGNPEKHVEDTVRRYDLEQSYECTGYVGRNEVARWIQRSDLGLAVSGGSPQEMTTKIFDYIACKTAILGCGPEGSMTEVIERFEFGYVASNETNQIKNTLLEIIEQQPASLGDGPYDEYTRGNSAQELEKIIENIDG
ncbi:MULTISPECIES: glycosyltransferase [Halolamina]|uniref:Glycosyltransferase involved in cell wall bisynthesis n=1 Tax=Halolamina pelagica TaxID=699431 RepID=A0A1I5V130_9EURY|nr:MULTISPECIES: glycosyltransferase [Halolamina]NHX36806.1 glycosyltransferase family 4 protein [Halolamina sp. R1-12]SFQ00666.1 Glycosyltransferase involved in cell wall bisynthesis [Halolamina pelagica]